VQVTVTKTGTYSGKIWFGARMCAFSGRLSGTTDENVMGQTTLRCGTATLPIRFNINAATKVLEGFVGGVADTKDRGLQFYARCSGWHATTNPYPHAGLYTAAMVPQDLDAKDLSFPHGIGYFGGTIATNGVVTMAARLADNTVVTITSVIGSDNLLSLHFLLYGGTGSIQGWLIAGGGDLDGGLKWVKLPQAGATRSYKAGFPLHNLITVGGFKPAVPTGGNRWIDAGGGSPNSQLIFDRGGIDGWLTQKVTLNTNNTISVAPGYFAMPALVNEHSRFTGTLNALGNTGTFYGVFIPRLDRGVGHFQLPEAPGTTSRILSGRVQFNRSH
jgi:hypothetical protein